MWRSQLDGDSVNQDVLRPIFAVFGLDISLGADVADPSSKAGGLELETQVT